MTSDSDFVFEVTPQKRPDDESMLQDIRAFAAQNSLNNRRMQDYVDWPKRKFHPHTILKHLGKWTEVMAKAGVEFDKFANSRVARSDIESDLRRFAQIHTLDQRTWNSFKGWKDRKISVHSIRPHFGTWYEAMMALGIECPTKTRSNKHSDEELLAATETVWRWSVKTYKRSPQRKDFKAYIASHTDGISDGTLVRRFGHLGAYLKAFAEWKNGKITRHELLKIRPTKSAKRSPIPKRLRFDMLAAAGHKCQSCGKSPTDDAELHIDHVLPVVKGGTNDPANLRVLCDVCNLGRSDRYSE